MKNLNYILPNNLYSNAVAVFAPEGTSTLAPTTFGGDFFIPVARLFITKDPIMNVGSEDVLNVNTIFNAYPNPSSQLLNVNIELEEKSNQIITNIYNNY